MQDPPAFIPQTPFCGREISRGKAENPFSPEKLFFRFAESIFKPRHTARISLRAEPQRKMSFPFSEKNRARANPKCKEHFFFLGLPSEARRWRGFRGA